MIKQIVIITLLVVGIQGCAYAGTKLTNDTGVRALLGEAESEPMMGKIAVAEVIRRRGGLKGIYGYKTISMQNGKYYRKVSKTSKYYKKTGNLYRKLSDAEVMVAKAAWADSAHTNYSRGATHFENINAFGTPDWAKNMIITARIGNHVFMKER